jgi:hypothetical protein
MTPRVSQPEWRQPFDTLTGYQVLGKIRTCLDDLWCDHSEIPGSGCRRAGYDSSPRTNLGYSEPTLVYRIAR